MDVIIDEIKKLQLKVILHIVSLETIKILMEKDLLVFMKL